ncbi:nascent polypeptide-associated complex protein [Halocatena salina]|uniref:Nascent polypeptide-associated complex protein n=1 Tax=Halocatena salina TaxID=2934340 RepID=A0A8T9ZZJ3_9EURY|nr:nascent polypeptide-associated complex protein [Halocatena salina]UPM41936.1 nascent polypeptide-associated complex protein [Halocatena salina]
MFGGGGLDPRKMQQMMEQMGIDTSDIDAEEVIIRTADEDLVFTSPEVQRISAQGQATYQIVGEPDTRDTSDDTAEDGREAIPEDDVEIVVQRTGVSTDEAREALEAEDGDLAAAVSRLE